MVSHDNCSRHQGRGRHRSIILVAVAAWLWSTAALGGGTIIYVDDDAPKGGDGATWKAAFRFLQDALAFAADPAHKVGEIRVAAGEYRPDRDEMNPQGTGDRTRPFMLVSDVAVLGGFAGINGRDPDERDPTEYPSLLSGDLAGDDNPGFDNRDDNSVHVVLVAGAGAGTRLDGCTVLAGWSDGDESPNERGAGVLVDGGQLDVILSVFREHLAAEIGSAIHYMNGATGTVQECTFVGNDGKQGSGLGVQASTVNVVDCVFLENDASTNGAGAYVVEDGVLTVTDSLFSRNEGRGAAGVFVEHSALFLTRCHFTENETETGATAIFVLESSLNALDCTFSRNFTLLGTAGVMAWEDANCMLQGCLFVANQAEDNGVILSESTDAVITDCVFALNLATHNLGVMSTRFGSALFQGCLFVSNGAFGSAAGLLLGSDLDTVTDCVFMDNVAGEQGGALALNEVEATIINCAFIDNQAEIGAGVSIDPGAGFGGTPVLHNCFFQRNRALQLGGGLYLRRSNTTPSIVNCEFLENEAGVDGGALYNDERAEPTLINCTFASNTAGGLGGGIFNDDAEPFLSNCILWANSDPTGFNESSQIFGGSPNVNFSCIQGLTGGLGGDGNIGDDPAFVSLNLGNLRLLPGSPCLDSGNNNAVPGGVTEDLDGFDRFVDADGDGNFRVDMGAFEYDFRDCNRNELDDGVDIAAGTVNDCNENGIPDECDFANDDALDCNDNGVPDVCDIANGFSLDCNFNGVPDQCDILDGTGVDCNDNGLLDECDFYLDLTVDCNLNGVPDECDGDCNGNGFADDCDIADGVSFDCNDNGIPDECEEDCNGNGIADECELAGDCNDNGVLDICEDDCNRNGVADECDITGGTSNDFNDNGIPDECEEDCNGNGVPDFIDIDLGLSEDCNDNGIPDECDVADGTSSDFNENGIPDECETDCNANGLPDFIDIAFGISQDCDGNGIPDECEIDCNGNGLGDACDIEDATSLDCNGNGVPDECEEDCNRNGLPDECDVVSAFKAVSDQLSPFGFESPQELLIQDAPSAAGDVTLKFSASANLEQPERRVTIEINGTFVGQAFIDGAAHCPDEADQDQLVINVDLYNLIVDGGDALISAIPSNDVDVEACEQSFIIIAIDYLIDAISEDRNDNGVPDECEALGDLDGDGVVGSSDLVILLGAWGFCADCFDCPIDLDSDCIVGATDLLILLGNWS